ncbi:hypothetical protein LguiB_029950 [Lonicera macranthoides]
MMLPTSIRCNTCGNYIYKGTKFNSRKADVIGETYLGIQIFRFYFKCTKCSAKITMKTDPQYSDYVVELGAARNFEPWRAEDEVADEEKRKKDAEGMGDAMKSLENRTLDSKREMDILAALDEVKSMKSRHATVTFDIMLEALKRSAPQMGSREVVKRIHDEDLDDDDDEDSSLATIDNGDTSINNLKKRKVSKEDSGNPTDHLTKTSILVGSKKKENPVNSFSSLRLLKFPSSGNRFQLPAVTHQQKRRIHKSLKATCYNHYVNNMMRTMKMSS